MGKSLAEEFIDQLDEKIQKRVFFVLKLAKETGILSSQYFKKLSNTDDIWEIRVQNGGNIFRFLCFWGRGNALVITHGFQKKTEKTPKAEIERAEHWKKIYFRSHHKK